MIFRPFAARDEHEIESTLGHEEPVRAVHDLLPAKIPDVRLHIIAVDLDRPLGYLDAGRALEFFVLVGEQSMNQCRLTNATATDEYELEFVERLASASNNAEVVVEDLFCV